MLFFARFRPPRFWCRFFNLKVVSVLFFKLFAILVTIGSHFGRVVRLARQPSQTLTSMAAMLPASRGSVSEAAARENSGEQVCSRFGRMITLG